MRTMLAVYMLIYAHTHRESESGAHKKEMAGNASPYRACFSLAFTADASVAVNVWGGERDTHTQRASRERM